MDEKLESNKQWPCASCRKNLANVVSGEIAVILENVVAINTEGVNLILTCKGCGKTKAWFAKPLAIVKADHDNMVREVVTGVVKALKSESQ